MQLDRILSQINKLEDNNLAVVLGASYGALSIVRSLGREGVPVIVIGNTDFIGYSRYCTYYIKAGNNDEVIQNLILIAEKYKRKIVLLTDSDNYINLIYENWMILKEKYVSHLCADFDTFELLTNKSKLYLLSNQLGIDSPKTYFSYELERINKFPVIVKPLDKSKLSSIKGNKVALCNSKEELLKIVDFVKSCNTDCIIQEIIEGDLSNLFSVTLYRSAKGHILVGYVGHKIRQYPINFGTVSSFVLKENKELIDKSIEILNEVNYIGVANFEYKYNPEENKYYVIEVNGRFPMSTGITQALGNKFVFNIYNSCLGKDVKQVQKDKQQTKIIWIHFLQDLRARLQLRNYSLFIIKLKIQGYKIQWALWDKNDIKPAMIYLKDTFWGGFRKRFFGKN